MSGKAVLAIVAAAAPPSQDEGTMSPVGLMGEAAAVAIGNAGINKHDIDGLFSASAFYYMPTLTLGEYLGITSEPVGGGVCGSCVACGTAYCAAGWAPSAWGSSVPVDQVPAPLPRVGVVGICGHSVVKFSIPASLSLCRRRAVPSPSLGFVAVSRPELVVACQQFRAPSPAHTLGVRERQVHH